MAENTENWTKLESDSRYPRKYEFEELEQVVSNLQELDFINYKGTVDNYADLAGLTELENGDAYVNAEDGLVYVWNGSSFPAEGDGLDISMKPIGVVEEGNEFAVSGGEVYNKTLTKDIYLELETVLSENLFNKESATIGHLGADGMTPTPSPNHRMSDNINVEPDTYYIKCVPNSLGTGYTYQFNLNNEVIKVNEIGLILTEPDCAYVKTVVNITLFNIDDFMFLKGVSEDLPTTYIPYGSTTNYTNIKNEYLDLKNDFGTENAPASQALVTSLVEQKNVVSPNLFDISTATIGHLGADGMTPTHSTNHRMSAPLYLPKGQQYIKCVPNSLNSGYNYFFDENDNVISLAASSTFTTPSTSNYSYCRVVYNVSSVNPNLLMLLRTIPAYLPNVFYPYQITQEYSIKESIAPIKTFNKYVAIGDSLTWGYAPRNIQLLYPNITSGNQIFSYAALFAEKHSNNFYNAGISGSTLAAITVGTTNNSPMVYRISDLPDDADLVTIMGGCNDIRQGIPLGVFSDTVETTYYGALHSICSQLIEKYITNRYNSELEPAKLYLITPTKFLQGAGELYSETQKTWVNAVKEVGEYYSIEVIDFHNESGLTPHVGRVIQGTNPDANAMYNPYMTDGIHITPKGYEEILYPYFKSKVN